LVINVIYAAARVLTARSGMRVIDTGGVPDDGWASVALYLIRDLGRFIGRACFHGPGLAGTRKEMLDRLASDLQTMQTAAPMTSCFLGS
jgi:hypothetical protein